MNATELRIGNWVQAGVYGRVPAEVIELVSDKIKAQTEGGNIFEQVFPLSLIEDYLINIGFEKSDYTSLRIYNKACVRVEVQEVYQKTSQKEVTQFTIKLDDSSQWKKIIYGIHELQNFYFVHTGAEIEE